MTNHALTQEEEFIIKDVRSRAAALLELVETTHHVSTRLEVLAAFLKSGRGQPNMLYALALTDEIYEILNGKSLRQMDIKVSEV